MNNNRAQKAIGNTQFITVVVNTIKKQVIQEAGTSQRNKALNATAQSAAEEQKLLHKEKQQTFIKNLAIAAGVLLLISVATHRLKK